MSDNWILSSLKSAEKNARERSKELHHQANCERRRAILLQNAAVQLENDQLSIQDVTRPLNKHYRY